MKTLQLLLLLLLPVLTSAQTNIFNGKLTGPLNGNAQDITLLDQLMFGASSASARIAILPAGTPTTTADGLQLGSDVNLYRSATDTLTLDASLVVTGTITGSGGIPRLNATQSFTGANTFSGATTFSLAPTLSQGLTIPNSTVRDQIRTGLQLVPGTHVQAWSGRLSSIAAANPGDGYFLVGDGSGWVSVPDTDLRNTIGLGDASSVVFNSLDLATPLAVSSGGTGLDETAFNAANLFAYSTGAGAMTTGTVSPFARTVLDDADATAALATLGISLPLGVTTGGTGLTSVATGRIIYTSSSNTFSTTALDAWARTNILTADSAATLRTTLGLATGSSVVMGDLTLGTPLGVASGGTGADLSSLVADRMLYTSATGVFTNTVLTSTGRSLLDDASTSDMRTTLGLGSASTPAFAGVTLTNPLGAAYGGLGLDGTALTAGRIPYATGSGWSTFTTTSYGRGLLASADLTEMLTNMGLNSPISVTQGGTGVSDAPAEGQLLVGNATGDYEFAASTTYGRSLWSTASAAAARTALELGSAGTPTFNSLTLTNPLGLASGGLGINTYTIGEDKIMYTTDDGLGGVDWMPTTLDPWIRTNLLAAASAAAVRSALNIGAGDTVELTTLNLTNQLGVLYGGTGLGFDGSAIGEMVLLTTAGGGRMVPRPLPRQRTVMTSLAADSEQTYSLVTNADTNSGTAVLVAEAGGSDAVADRVELPLPSTTFSVDVDHDGTPTTLTPTLCYDGRQLTIVNAHPTRGLYINRQTSATNVLFVSGDYPLPQDLYIPPNRTVRLEFRSTGTGTEGWYVLDAANVLRTSAYTTPFNAATITLTTLAHHYPLIRLTDDGANTPSSGTVTVTIPNPSALPVGHVFDVSFEDVNWTTSATNILVTTPSAATYLFLPPSAPLNTYQQLGQAEINGQYFFPFAYMPTPTALTVKTALVRFTVIPGSVNGSAASRYLVNIWYTDS